MESRSNTQRKTVQDLLEAASDAESQDVYYAIFTPKKIEKAVKQPTKNALAQIIKFDVYEIISVLIAILEECLVEANKDKSYLKLQEKIKCLRAELSGTLKEKNSSLSAFKALRETLIPGLQKLIDDIARQYELA